MLAASPSRSRSPWWIAAAAVALCASGAGVAALIANAPDKRYSQATPDATIETARLMVEQGKAARLDRLIYADSDEMRRLLRRTGVMLGNFQKLGDAIQTAFPAEIAAMKARVDDAAKSGKAVGLLSQIAQQAMPQRGKKLPQGPPRGEDREALENAVKGFFADPYAFLKESQTRVTTEFLTDDSVSLRWDGKPILPPIGLQMRLSGDGKWYFALPTGIPGASRILPRTADEYAIWGSLIEVFDQMILDLTDDIQKKRVTTLDQTAKKAGEKAFIPAAMVVFAYTKALEERKKTGG